MTEGSVEAQDSNRSTAHDRDGHPHQFSTCSICWKPNELPDPAESVVLDAAVAPESQHQSMVTGESRVQDPPLVPTTDTAGDSPARQGG